MEQHTKLLKNRCRVCGNKPRGYVHNKQSKACGSLLSTLLAIDVMSESEDIFPPVVCNSCYITLKKAKEERTDQHCQCIPSQPVELDTCRHHLCIQCIKSGITACPCTENSSILANHISKPSPLTLNIIGSLLVRCTDCGEVMELQHLMTHASSKCEHTTVPCPSKVTVKQLLLDREQGSKQSLMELHNMELVAEKLVPSNGHVTLRSSSGKVRKPHNYQCIPSCILTIVATNSCKNHHTCSGLCHSIKVDTQTQKWRDRGLQKFAQYGVIFSSAGG